MISEKVKRVISLLNDANYEAFVVGGSVRDALIGKAISDWDITTNATPEEVKAVFKDFKVIDTGIQHGTVTLRFEKESFEITTYRVDSEYLDHRHPKVEFTRSLEEDLKRRDFTMNALAFHPDKGIIDLFEGKEDINRGIVRSVGDGNQRFEEDALRILRGLRFGAKLGFEIEKNTSEAMFNKKELLAYISKERVTVELLQLLKGIDAEKYLFEYKDVWDVAISGIGKAIEMNSYGVFDGLKDDAVLRLAKLLIPLDINEVNSILSTLKLTNKENKRIVDIYENQHTIFELDEVHIKKLLSLLGVELFEDLIEICADNKREILEIKSNILNNGYCYKLSMLKITGNELLELNVLPMNIGKLLSEILVLVIENKVSNDKETIIKYITKNGLI